MPRPGSPRERVADLLLQHGVLLGPELSRDFCGLSLHDLFVHPWPPVLLAAVLQGMGVVAARW